MTATTTTTAPGTITRDEAIRRIRAALRARSGKAWTVRGGRGTARGWITIDAPPARRVWRLEPVERYDGRGTLDYVWKADPTRAWGYCGPDDARLLADLLGLPSVFHHGVEVAASDAYYREYIDRAEGRAPSVRGTMYWD